MHQWFVSQRLCTAVKTTLKICIHNSELMKSRVIEIFVAIGCVRRWAQTKLNDIDIYNNLWINCYSILSVCVIAHVTKQLHQSKECLIIIIIIIVVGRCNCVHLYIWLGEWAAFCSFRLREWKTIFCLLNLQNHSRCLASLFFQRQLQKPVLTRQTRFKCDWDACIFCHAQRRF